MLSSALLFVALSYGAANVAAFQDVPGTACFGSGACTYTYDDLTLGTQTTVNGFCAPDGICADNGATCTTTDDCYNDCGSDGICGGQGAVCTSQLAFQSDLNDVTCFTPCFDCSIDGVGGFCGFENDQGCASLQPSGTTKRQRAKRDSKARAKARKVCQDQGPSFSLCPVGGRKDAFECIDVESSLEMCGGCPGETGHRDCTMLPGVMSVECVEGQCVSSSCEFGYNLVKGSCVPLLQSTPKGRRQAARLAAKARKN